MIKKANEDLQNVKKYLDPTSANYYPNYISNLKALKNSSNPPTRIDAKITTAEANLKIYQTTETQARAAITEFQPKIQALITAKDYWGAQDAKKNEYLFILDEESCLSTQVDWIAMANACGTGKWGIPFTAPVASGSYTFANKSITYSAATQTDAVRIWNDKVVLDKLTITDSRTYDEAHRDAIQLIPPPKYQDNTDSASKPIKLKLADQMAVTILESPTVKNCVIEGVNASLQGIFMSDGLCRKVLPLRIGGGARVYITGFSAASQQKGYVYSPIAGLPSASDERTLTTGYAAKPDSYFYSNVDMDLLQAKIRQAGAKPNYREIILQLTKEKDPAKRAKLERYIPPIR